MKLNISISSDMLLFFAAMLLCLNGIFFKVEFIQSCLHVFMWLMLAERLVNCVRKSRGEVFKKKKDIKGQTFEISAECHDYSDKLSRQQVFSIAVAYIVLAITVNSRLDWSWMCLALLAVGIGTLYDAFTYNKEKAEPTV